ncbi:hypothetical protein L3X38_026115 [Prunus dulcis]|uniref:Leucine-rich repeat-containing N-terminal plant-type domain-containing protein n=1 Tax=Prunus dulcis TaxID=3755 RepID=A0AAD4W3Q3_PRUDU|nr:hypothetical protein L3X38_026115 [Prunus dulcis]
MAQPFSSTLYSFALTQCYSLFFICADSGEKWPCDECSALFKFKESFTVNKSASVHPFAFPKVASWKREGDQNRSNCCSWKGVECDEESGHIVGLDLSSSCLYGSLNSNSSLFQLVHLQRLDLSDNDFHFSEIPSRLGHDLTNLTYLNLSLSGFSGQLPTSLGEVKVGALHKVSMWDFVQVVVVATRVLEIRFGSWELRQVSGTSEVCLSSAGEKAWLPWC